MIRGRKLGHLVSIETRKKISIANTGKFFSEERKKKSSEIAKKLGFGKWMIGKKHSEETKKKMSNSQKGKIITWGDKISKSKKGKKPYIMTDKIRKHLSESKTGEKNWRWIEDRNLVLENCRRDTTEYYYWKKAVLERDNFTCKINNKDCNGKVVAHHILRWATYPELRYNINNGISLCKFHHPLKRDEIQKMIPIFNNLIKANTTNYIECV